MFRKLTEAEILRLSENNNSADNWDNILVVGTFFVDGVRNCHFSGVNYIGENAIVENVAEMRNCRIGANCLIRNVGEMVADKNSDYSFSIHLCNEQPEYPVTIVPGMNSTDVFTALCSSQPTLFVQQLQTFDFVTVGDNAVVKNVLSVHNSYIGNGAVVADAVSISDSWIGCSGIEQITAIGSGVVLRKAIVHKGSSVTFGAKVSSSMIGENCEISYDTRVYDSVIGDCSCISGCEIGNSFLYPFHSQHHSNSFLIAGHVGGQSNIAAGATLGSNHNGRINDGEFCAGRGFWAGLSSSIAMPSNFAPFTLLVKGDYLYPLNIGLAFSLVCNNTHENTLDILPAYWWIHNAYALFRNELKFKSRDTRENPSQVIDSRVLAPDTITAVIDSHKLLKNIVLDENVLNNFELSDRKIRVLEIEQGMRAYESMILCYIFQVFGLELYKSDKMSNMLENESDCDQLFVNAGGQILTRNILYTLSEQKTNQLESNHKLQSEFSRDVDSHIRKSALWALKYFAEENTSFNTFCGTDAVDWKGFANCSIEQMISFYERVVSKRIKDLESPFKKNVNNMFSRDAVVAFENDSTVEAAKKKIAELKKIMKSK